MHRDYQFVDHDASFTILADRATFERINQNDLDGRIMASPAAVGKSLIVRTDSPGADYQMPPGDPLSAPERCALIHWVQNGAMAGSAM